MASACAITSIFAPSTVVCRVQRGATDPQAVAMSPHGLDGSSRDGAGGPAYAPANVARIIELLLRVIVV